MHSSTSFSILEAIFRPCLTSFLIIVRIIVFQVKRVFFVQNNLCDNSLVFVVNNSLKSNVLFHISNSLATVSKKKGYSAISIDIKDLHKYKIINSKIVFMHWAVSDMSIFFKKQNKIIIWFSHSRLNVFSYLGFLREASFIFFQNSLDYSLIRSYIPLDHACVYPGILFDFPNPLDSFTLSSEEWTNRDYDICFFLSMNSLDEKTYYNNRKNIDKTLHIASELSNKYSILILANEYSYIYSKQFLDKNLSSYSSLVVERRFSFPDNLSQLRMSRFFINSSLMEGGPIGILEAIYSGCIPISSFYSMALSLNQLVQAGMFFDINDSIFTCVERISEIVEKSTANTLDRKQLISDVKLLTESSFIARILEL
jgi:hypothetical protein